MKNIAGITHIVDGVYLGKARAYYANPQLQKAGLKRILKLYLGAPYWPDAFLVCENTLDDGVFIPLEKLQRGVTFIQESVNAGAKILVVCGAGMSRSVTFVLAYMLEKGYDLKEAWQLLHSQHPPAHPTPAMWQSLIEHYQLPHKVEEVIHWPLTLSKEG